MRGKKKLERFHHAWLHFVSTQCEALLRGSWWIMVRGHIGLSRRAATTLLWYGAPLVLPPVLLERD